MKAKFLLFSPLLATLLPGQQGFTNVIEMVELGAGSDAPLIWSMPGTIAATGNNVLVGEPVPEGGAVFILSTIQAAPFQDWLLDQTAIGAYLPQAEVEILTHDTEAAIPRTRADQPFQVKVKVSGLYDPADLSLPPEVIQQAASEVRLQLFKESYPAGQNLLPGGEVTSPAYDELSLVGNGDFPRALRDLTFYTSLGGSRPDRARGEEHVIVRSLDDGVNIGSTLAQAKVQVWPVWWGFKEGLDEAGFLPYQFSGDPESFEPTIGELDPDPNFVLADGEIAYEAVPPEMTFHWKDLYPTSTTKVIVNDASIPYPWGGREIGGVTKQHNEDGSFDWSMTVTNWEGIFGGQGRYAIWMVTHTPGIGWEVGGLYASNGSFTPGGWIIPIAREGIKIRGSVHSLAE